MADKVQLIKEEIERRYNCERCYPLDREANVAAAVLQELWLFIDSLPEETGCEVNFTTKNEDLVEEVDNFLKDPVFGKLINRNAGIALAIHFAEWQKQQMMKDAVEGEVIYQIGSSIIAPTDIKYKVMSDRVYISNVKLGDKVKIIIVKEDQ